MSSDTDRPGDGDKTISWSAAGVSETTPSPAAGIQPVARPSIEGYEILEEIGRGGMGVVYEARQLAAGGRSVALKVMLSEQFASARQLHRFEREIEIAAELNHAGIAQIYDSGLTHGRHYFAMELIEGEPLDQFCVNRKIPLTQRLKLFISVCDAVAYAHQRGVIHRDLKPSNILVDAKGNPHLLDFGLAKLGEAKDEESFSMLTMQGAVLGTLPYMSPEQARGDLGAIDTRTDVYALGVILYELLTGTYPYEVVGQMASVLRHIADAEPMRPSTVNREIGDEVETIILRTLSKSPDRRYASAQDLAQDLTRFLKGEPIEAKRDSGLYVLRKTIRRYWVPLAIAAACTIAVAAFGVVALVLYRQAEDARAAAETEAAARRAQLWRIFTRQATDDLGHFRRDHAEKRLWSIEQEGRFCEWGYLMRKCRPEVLLISVSGETEPAGKRISSEWSCLSISPDGRWVVSAEPGEPPAIRDLLAEDSRRTLDLKKNSAALAKFSPDGKYVAITAFSRAVSVGDALTHSAGQVWIFETESGLCVNTIYDLEWPGYGVFINEPDRMVIQRAGCYPVVADVRTGADLPDHAVSRLVQEKVTEASMRAPDGDGKPSSSRLWFDVVRVFPKDERSAEQQAACLIDPHSMATIDDPRPGVPVAHTPDLDHIVRVINTATTNNSQVQKAGVVNIWSRKGGVTNVSLGTSTRPWHDFYLLPGGREPILLRGRGTRLSYVDCLTGRLTAEVMTINPRRVPEGMYLCLVSSLTLNRHLAFTRNVEGTGGVYESVPRHAIAIPEGATPTAIELSPDGSRMFLLWNNELQIFRTGVKGRAQLLRRCWNWSEGWKVRPRFVRGNRIVREAETGLVVEDTDTGHVHLSLPGTRGCGLLSADGAYIAGIDQDNWLTVWDTATGERALGLQRQQSRREGQRFTPTRGYAFGLAADGGTLALGGPALVLAEVSTTNQTRKLGVGAFVLEFSPDGTELALGKSNGNVEIWDSKATRRKALLDRHGASISSIRFVNNQPRILTCAENGSATLWDTDSDEPILSWPATRDDISCPVRVTISDDGSTIAEVHESGMFVSITHGISAETTPETLRIRQLEAYRSRVRASASARASGKPEALPTQAHALQPAPGARRLSPESWRKLMGLAPRLPSPADVIIESDPRPVLPVLEPQDSPESAALRQRIRERQIPHTRLEFSGGDLVAFDAGGTGFADCSLISDLKVERLYLWDTQITNIDPLADMPIYILNIGGTRVKDLSPLTHLRLSELHIYGTDVNNLSPLTNCPIRKLDIRWIPATDISVLTNLPLAQLQFSPERVTNGIDALRGMTGLTLINELPAAEFWKQWDTPHISPPQAERRARKTPQMERVVTPRLPARPRPPAAPGREPVAPAR